MDIRTFQIHKQTRDNSCGPSCILMTINYFKPGLIPMTNHEEHTIHDKIGSAHLWGNTVPSSICKYLLGLGFKVNYYLFRTKERHELLEMFLKEDEMIRSTIHHPLNFRFYLRNFGAGNIKNELKRGKLVFVPVNLGDRENIMLHWLLIIDYQGTFLPKFIYVDPYDGEIKTMPKSKLVALMDLIIGKVFISVWK
jgi:hypothetical protein